MGKKSLDQLYYIKRCTKLTDLNLKYNPVASELTYYQKLQDHAPRLQYLDDELVLPGHFDKKTEELKLSQRVKSLQTDSGLNSNILSASERALINRLVQLGAQSEEVINRWTEEALGSLEKEPSESELLLTSIKNFTKEKKALHSGGYDSQEDALFSDQEDGFKTTPKKKMRETVTIFKQTSDGPQQPQMYRTGNSFFKTTSRSTALSSNGSARSIFQGKQAPTVDTTQDTGASDLVSNTDRTLAGTPLSILRQKRTDGKSRYQPTNLFSQNSSTSLSKLGPQDICSLLNEFQVLDLKPKVAGLRNSFSKEQAQVKTPSGPTRVRREESIPLSELNNHQTPTQYNSQQDNADSAPKPIRKLKVTPISGNKNRSKLKIFKKDEANENPLQQPIQNDVA